MAIAAVGSVVGLLGARAGARLVSTALYGVDALDPVVFVVVTVVLGTVALLACALSALHAARVDPVQALRAE